MVHARRKSAATGLERSAIKFEGFATNPGDPDPFEFDALEDASPAGCLLFMTGIVGRMFREFAPTLTTAVTILDQTSKLAGNRKQMACCFHS